MQSPGQPGKPHLQSKQRQNSSQRFYEVLHGKQNLQVLLDGTVDLSTKSESGKPFRTQDVQVLLKKLLLEKEQAGSLPGSATATTQSQAAGNQILKFDLTSIKTVTVYFSQLISYL